MSESAPFEEPMQAAMRIDIKELVRGGVKLMIETALEEEVREMVGGGKWQRLSNRRDLRNGSYFRKLLTTMGLVEIQVPRTRENGAPVDVLGRYQRRQDDIDAAITEAYVGGVSTRKMGDVTEALLGEDVSKSTVSRVTKKLDDAVER